MFAEDRVCFLTIISALDQERYGWTTCNAMVKRRL